MSTTSRATTLIVAALLLATPLALAEDLTAPVIDAHADLTVEATGPDGAIATYEPPATHDDVDGEGVATCTPAPGSLFALGDTTVTCEATDAAGNQATPVSFVVSVVDTTAPAIDAHADLLVYTDTALEKARIVLYDAPIARDAVAGDAPASCAPASGTSFPLGTTTVMCTASDAAGNAASSSFDVTVSFDVFGSIGMTQASYTVVEGATGAPSGVYAIESGNGKPLQGIDVKVSIQRRVGNVLLDVRDIAGNTDPNGEFAFGGAALQNLPTGTYLVSARVRMAGYPAGEATTAYRVGI